MSACAWCGATIEPPDVRARFCGRRCRQAAWRARRGLELERSNVGRKRVAYADPPYPGLARKYYADRPEYRGEVDHVALVAELQTFDGWALSTSARALRDLLPLCPEGARVCPWVKPHPVPEATAGPHNAWEAVIVVPARLRPPGVPDFLVALPARLGGSDLPGRKPLAFVRWLVQLLGLEPGDEFVDLFPGSGVVGATWREICRSADTSALEQRRIGPRPSLEALGDVSPVDERRASVAAAGA